MDVTVLVGTYGDGRWADLARERAIPSADAFGVPVIHVHSHSLHDARNEAAALADTEWLCHLDADDELEPGYFEAMEGADYDLRVPMVRYVTDSYLPLARFPMVAGHSHDCEAECLTEGNWLVVGTLVRKQMLDDIGGWRDYGCYEDYDLWVRCWQAGAVVDRVPGAVYRAHVRPDSRNRGPAQSYKHRVHQQIAKANGLKVPV